jgi:high-affinity iron transporter
MRKPMMRAVMGVMMMALLMFSGMAVAQPPNPAQAAEDVRLRLFEAQVALMGQDTAQAALLVEEAAAHYSAIAPDLALASPAADARIGQAFDGLLQAVKTSDGVAFAYQRGMLWASVLGGSAEVIVQAAEQGDGERAALWLPLRDFRASTRFTRPDANATMAVQGLLTGQGVAAEVAALVRADLYDTYQAQLAASLSAADAADASGFALRRAEESGLAAGYFAILGAPYADQRGAEAVAGMDALWARLAEAASSGDSASYRAVRADLDAGLVGFRAAPLSEAELARRAGQLVRFTALVPIEYGRGVRNGQVVNDIEIQEAVTFHAGAQAAYLDLTTALADLDAGQAAELGRLLTLLIEQVRVVADPAEVEQTARQIDQIARGMMPEAWLRGGADSDFDVIVSVLDQVRGAVGQGDYIAAESARIEAYALLEMGTEQRLRGFAPDLAVTVESLFWQGTPDQTGLATLLAERASLSAVNQAVGRLKAALAEAQTVLRVDAAPEAVIGNAAVIVFREGLEAVLILASLLASLRTVEERRYRRPLLAGAALAFGATVITWVLAQGLLSVLLPLGERLEAIVSLIAIGVLLLITNWFFHKVYWTGWMANFHAQKRRLVGGLVSVHLSQMIGLVLLGFTSIYREGFETVLFLQSLVLEAGAAVVLQGVVIGLAATSVVGVVTFALQVRLPYKKMLIVTGVMIGAVLLVMVGHTVHVMQAIGWLPITPIQGVYLPYWVGQWFGVFATWQGVVLQFAAAAFVIGSYFLAEGQQKRQRQRHAAKPSAA